jgi:hypothetical protein
MGNLVRGKSNKSLMLIGRFGSNSSYVSKDSKVTPLMYNRGVPINFAQI